MTFILIGCLAFVFFCVFDLNKVTFRLKAINIGFAIGIVLIAYSTIGILLGDYGGVIWQYHCGFSLGCCQ